MCKCKCCNKEFEYGDSESPVYVNKVWWDLLDYYNLWRYQAEAEDRFYKAYAKWRRNMRSKFLDRDDYHCYICHECASKALGRALTIDDIEVCPLSKPYIETYLNQ